MRYVNRMRCVLTELPTRVSVSALHTSPQPYPRKPAPALSVLIRSVVDLHVVPQSGQRVVALNSGLGGFFIGLSAGRMASHASEALRALYRLLLLQLGLVCVQAGEILEAQLAKVVAPARGGRTVRRRPEAIECVPVTSVAMEGRHNLRLHSLE
jgi:hypothetical protein